MGFFLVPSLSDRGSSALRFLPRLCGVEVLPFAGTVSFSVLTATTTALSERPFARVVVVEGVPLLAVLLTAVTVTDFVVDLRERTGMDGLKASLMRSIAPTVSALLGVDCGGALEGLELFTASLCLLFRAMKLSKVVTGWQGEEMSG